MVFYNEWFDILSNKIKPENIVKTNFLVGVSHLLLGTALVTLVLGFWGFLTEAQGTLVEGFRDPIVLIIAFVLMVVFSLIHQSAVWILARLFGGKGKYEHHVGALSKTMGAILAAGAILFLTYIVLSRLNVVFILVILLTLLIFGIYGILLIVKVVQNVHQISEGRAGTAVLLVLVASKLIDKWLEGIIK